MSLLGQCIFFSSVSFVCKMKVRIIFNICFVQCDIQSDILNWNSQFWTLFVKHCGEVMFIYRNLVKHRTEMYSLTQSKSRSLFLCADGLDDVELAGVLFSRWGFCGPLRRLSSYSQCQCTVGPRRPSGVSVCVWVRDTLWWRCHSQELQSVFFLMPVL